MLVRPPVSNVDNLMIVVAAKEPDPDFGLIDKILVTAEAKGINPFICINKTDLCRQVGFLCFRKGEVTQTACIPCTGC